MAQQEVKELMTTSQSGEKLQTCHNCPLICMKFYRALGPSGVASIRAAQPERHLPRHAMILVNGDSAAEIYSLRSGWAFSFILLPDGRRQILSFYLPGDIIDPIAMHGDPLWFSVQALTDVELCAFERKTLLAAIENRAEAKRDMDAAARASISNRDFRLVDLGRRRAVERIAQLILGVVDRYACLNLLDDGSLSFPLRQEHIGDALGLTRVHVSRVLAELRAKGAIETGENRLAILDREVLERLAGPRMMTRETEDGLFVN